MSNGKSLEKIGVILDELRLPSGEDISLNRDPELLRAIEIAEVKVSPAGAGKFLPVLWRK